MVTSLTESNELYINDGQGHFELCEDSGLGVSKGSNTMALADIDGDLDLFVGGNFNPGRYPEDVSSRLFINENGNFVLDHVNSRKLNNIGLVSGALFSDYDGDGDPDLLLSREWDSIVLLENSEGNFNDVSSEQMLFNYK